MPLRASGANVEDPDGSKRVFLREKDSGARQRFTIIHELGHLLLRAAAPKALAVAESREIETWFDEFAGEVLLPRTVVDRALLDRRLDPLALVDICAAEAVSLGVVLTAARHRLAANGLIAVDSEFRGHARRPDVVGYRVSRCSGHRDTFLPVDQRLESLGFTALAERARVAPHRELFAGSDGVRISVRRKPSGSPSEARRWGNVQTQVQWEAAILDRRHVRLLTIVNAKPLLSTSDVSAANG